MCKGTKDLEINRFQMKDAQMLYQNWANDEKVTKI